jgi:hypothetical protein
MKDLLKLKLQFLYDFNFKDWKHTYKVGAQINPLIRTVPCPLPEQREYGILN